MMYLCHLHLYENSERMESFSRILDECKIGQQLNGKEIANELELPVPVVAACFEVYEAKGYGLCSETIGAVNYCGIA